MADIIDFNTKKQSPHHLTTMSEEEIQKMADEIMEVVVLNTQVKKKLLSMEEKLIRISKVDPDYAEAFESALSCTQECLSVLGRD